jgi:type VI secretion system protein ImpH
VDAAWRQQAFAQLMHAVRDEPWAHDFFALMRRVDALRPELPRTGQALRPAHEAVRLAQPPEMDFAPAPLQKLELREGAAPRLSVRFFGLLGPQGPMPLHLTEYVRERSHQHGDSATAHFLDLFHHRMLALFYRAWAQAQPVVHGDRPHDDRYIAWLGALAGLPADTGLPRQALAHQAGLLAGRTRHPEALAKVLSQQFGVPAQVQPHVPQWLAIEPVDRSRLGFARNRLERAQCAGAGLGASANLGSRVWDRQYRFRLLLGPLSLERYLAFLPGGALWQPLRQWMGLLARPELQWELALRLAPAERPQPRLASGARPAPRRPAGMRLGIDSWLAPRASADSAADRAPLRIRPETSFLRRRPLPTGA